MGANDIRNLEKSGFTIGSHTNTHRELTSISWQEAKQEIYTGKAWLEDCLGKEVDCFCYPCGKYNNIIMAIVKEIGFKSARTVRNYHRDIDFNPFATPTTLQIFPHDRRVLLRNFISGGDYTERFGAFKCAMQSHDLLARLLGICSISDLNSHRIHFWGHSSELDGFDGWRILENLISTVIASRGWVNQ